MGKRYGAVFKGKVALEAIRGEATIAELVMKHGLDQTPINAWKRQAIEGWECVFRPGRGGCCGAVGRAGDLHAKIGQLVVERNLFWRKPPDDVPLCKVA